MSDLQVNVETWIQQNQEFFQPPVCNKLMHFGQLNVMFVGGPNTRKDYHIEEGEELFFQVRGQMCLKVVENGKHKDVHIREGEMFLLPARVPHSPQRQSDTVGLVVERRRLSSETDCLRYYIENSTNLLFERWFHCEDLGTQLVPVINEFMASTQNRTGRPDPNEVFREPPFPLNPLNVMTPFSLKSWLEKNRSTLMEGGNLDLFGKQFETEAVVFGPGDSGETTRPSDVWIWQLEGESVVKLQQQKFRLRRGDSVLVPEHSTFSWCRGEGTVALFVAQNPERKQH